MNTKLFRNVNLDILRGYFLLLILVDHLSFYLGNSVFTLLNGNGKLWVSAAEGFVFLSGYFVGYIYLEKLKLLGLSTVTRKLVFRAAKLYIISVVLTLVYTYVGVASGNPPPVSMGIMYTTFQSALYNSLLLRYTYGWADILVLYVAFLLLSPLILAFISRGKSVIVFLFSLLLWFVNLYETECQRACVSFFDLSSWQFIYVLGILISTKRKQLNSAYSFLKRSLSFRLLLMFVFTVSVTFSVLHEFYGFFETYGISVELFIETAFNTETLGPGRLLLFAVWITVFYLLIDTYVSRCGPIANRILLIFGQNSLFTYVIQSVVVFAAYFLSYEKNILTNTVVNIFSIIVVFVLLCCSVYIKRGSRHLKKFLNAS